MDWLFLLNQALYWIALSTWFGGVLFVALAAPVVFRVVGEARPLLPGVLSVNLDDQHSTLLAGSIVSELIALLNRVQRLCIIVLAITLLGQWLLAITPGMPLLLAILRTSLFVAAAAAGHYHARSIWPRIVSARDRYIDNADNPEVANPAKDEFDRLHADSVAMLRNLLFMLLGMILFSGTIRVALELVLD
jgi:hypothetical protein